MAHLRLDQVQEGMELASDVTNRNGQVMIRQGSRITPKELRLLNLWGVAELDVVGAEGLPEDDADQLDELFEQYRPEAEELFRHVNLEHPFSQKLLTLCIRALAERNSRGVPNGA